MVCRAEVCNGSETDFFILNTFLNRENDLWNVFCGSSMPMPDGIG